MENPLSNRNPDYSSMQDLTLVELVKAGGQKKDMAFAELCKRYERIVKAIAGRRVGYGGHLPDVVQDGFLNAFLKIGQLKGDKDTSFRRWLWSIAKNRENGYCRRQ